MNQTIKMLEGILGQEVVVYTKALEYSESKRAALISGNVEIIDALVKKEEITLQNIKKLEAAREQAIKEIAAELALSAQGLTLKKLAEKTGGAQGLTLLKLRKQLRSVIAKLSQNNTQNKALIETHMQYSAFCMGLATGAMNSTNTYTSRGEIGKEKASKHILFDGQA